MTQEADFRKKAEEIFSMFAYKGKDGKWWGHDTDLGPCDEAYSIFESVLIEARAEGEKSGYERGIREAAEIANRDHKAMEEHLTEDNILYLIQKEKQ